MQLQEMKNHCSSYLKLLMLYSNSNLPHFGKNVDIKLFTYITVKGQWSLPHRSFSTDQL